VAELHLEQTLPLPDLSEVFNLIDPDHTGVVNFYIYDSYDSRLTPLRRELKSLQEHDGDAARIAELLAEQNDIQQEVCTLLSDMLTHHHANLSAALEQMAYADFLLAKAELNLRWHLVHPRLDDHVCHHQLVNPRLRDRNEELGLRYQPVSVSVGSGVTLITGANMAGKTVLLKSICTAQLMMQCGMFAPALMAETMLFDDVVTSIGDEQNEMNGLSSYASEITRISDVIKRSKEEHLLVLIDEPARTTNPIEGKALVQSIATLMEERDSTTMITTHYSQLGIKCRRLRVKGFVDSLVDMPLSAQNINLFIDYSLVTDTSDEAPHEALRIAEMLECDEELIKTAKGFL
jgi:DNA mismatch repair ATPase MutS